jgi:cellulose synthase/poly-beta-1,6-N-acetylglucosamine synthase-like glycosyltransferase
MVKIFVLVAILIGLSFLSLNQLENLYEYKDSLVKAGVIFILTFSLIVIARYFILLLLSMLNLFRHIKEKRDTKSDHSKLVSVIVPCYDEDVVLKASLESLLKQTYRNFEIIVVDDGSNDNTLLIAKNMEFAEKGKRLIALTKPNAGKAEALNYGIEAARGELILSVDADSRLSPDAIELMVPYFEDEKVGAVAGSVYVTNQNTLWTKLQALEYIQGLNLVRNGQAYLKLVNIIPGPIGMFRKSAIIEAGWYQGDTYAEDCDLTLHLINSKYKIDYEIDAVSYTEAPEDLMDLLKQRYRWTRGILQSIMKHKDKLWKLHKNFSMSMVIWYMLFEAIFWPIASIFANIFIVWVGMVSGHSTMLIYWWIIFTVLDIAASLYCVSVTKEKMSLVLYALYYRLFFINVVNIAKVLATVEEFFGVQMNWGKLERKGRI